MKDELGRRRRAAWDGFGPLKEAAGRLMDLQASLFDAIALPALCYAAETWVTPRSESETIRPIREHQSDIFRSTGGELFTVLYFAAFTRKEGMNIKYIPAESNRLLKAKHHITTPSLKTMRRYQRHSIFEPHA